MSLVIKEYYVVMLEELNFLSPILGGIEKFETFIFLFFRENLWLPTVFDSNSECA
jgi:hypothetical protein